MIQKTFYNDKGYEIGLFDCGVFKKRIHGSKHILRMLDALGIDTKVVNELGKEGCYEIRAKDVENDVVYKIAYNDFIEHGIEKNFETPQIFCPRKYWNTGKQEKLL